MADGYRFPQQSAGNFYYPQHTQPHHSRHQIIRNSTPPNNLRSAFSADTPSPSRSPDSHSPAPNLYGMFNQGHQQGQHGRVNGGPGGRTMPGMLYNFPHNTHQQQQHAQHHANLQQDHAAHTTNGAVLAHHTSYSSGVLSNSTPNFTPSALQNGHAGTTTRGGQAQEISTHWGKQLELHKEAEKAHSSMVEGGAPHHFARLKAAENKTTVQPQADTEGEPQDDEFKDLGRMAADQFNEKRRQEWKTLDLSGQGLRVLTMPVFNYDFLRTLYLSSNKLKELPAAIGRLGNLVHLDLSFNQLTSLPVELSMCVNLEQLYLFDNRIQNLPVELGTLFKLEMLGIEGNPIDDEVKQLIMDRGTKELITHLRETAPIPLPPPPRDVLSLLDLNSMGDQETFKVFSFNILTAAACTPFLYGFSPAGALEWDYRREQIIQEIESQDADFVCLQEVDTETFKEYLSMKLAYTGYKGIFFPRGRARTMSEKEIRTVDGCATFYKGKKWILLDKQVIEFGNIAINRPDMKNHSDVFNRVMPRDHIAVIAYFENRLTGTRLIIVNTHFFWDPRFCDVKLVQGAILLDQVVKAAEKYTKVPPCKDKKKEYALAENEAPEGPSEPAPEPAPSKEYTDRTQIPLVICADQNSTATSAVFELFDKGSISPDNKEFGSFKYGNFTTHGIEHPFSLKSAYTNLDKTPDRLPFTNYTPNYKEVIDHVWYSTNALENISLLGPIDPTYMKTVPGFPNYHFPSDHIPLMAEFAVKGRKEKQALPQVDFGTSSRSNDRRRQN